MVRYLCLFIGNSVLLILMGRLMLFPEFKFVFIFLPILGGVFYFFYSKNRSNYLVSLLLIASVIFYALPNWSDSYIIISSIVFNYACYKVMHIWKNKEKLILYSGVAFNLLLICYFKYSFFIVDNISYITGHSWHFEKFILPVGISFYTFQQIAFLVDCYRDKSVNYNFKEYALFVSFFPQLIAGPIVHHKELMPQLMRLSDQKISSKLVSLGVAIFIVGVFKKLVLADNFAPISDTIFGQFDDGLILDSLSAWIGAVSYSLQLYFDFSAYSDMAVGLGLMFGIQLPINFNSPYKAVSVIDFWRRWHITLSTFLRDYLYIALGGNRHGNIRRYTNLLLTMLIGGLWHGAGWGFVIWGGIHGCYLIINHAYRYMYKQYKFLLLPVYLCQVITVLAVILAWVFFRSENLTGALLMIKSMFFLGEALKVTIWTSLDLIFIVMGLFTVFFLPNTLQFFAYKPDNKLWYEAFNCSMGGVCFFKTRYGVMLGFLAAISLMFMPKQTVFIYFNF